MPYIRVSLAQKLTQAERQGLVDSLGQALSLIPGKGAMGLIVDIEDGKTMYVSGAQQQSFVFIDVRYYSNYTYQAKKAFTEAAFSALEKTLGVSKDRMFLTITEYNSWGGFGDFKDEYYAE